MERATKRPRPLREVWKSTKLTRFERIMAWLGWTRADIVRIIPCAWCGQDFRFEGDTAGDPPRFCSNTHKTAANAARAKRAQELEAIDRRRIANEVRKAQQVPVAARPAVVPVLVEPAPVPEPARAKRHCSCTNHMGSSKVKYPSNGAAAIGLMRRHIAHGKHRIYQCPTSDYWHITSKPERKAA